MLISVRTDALETGTLNMPALLVWDAAAYVQVLPSRLSPEHVKALAALFAVEGSASHEKQA